jgi:hypothetical protein
MPVMPTTLRTITLQMAKNHLRVAWAVGDPREEDLQLKALAAEAIIFDHVSRNEPGRTTAATWLSPATTHPQAQAAVLIELGELWRYRGDDSDFASERQPRSNNPSTGQADTLAPAILGLLKLFTDPVLA